MKKPGVTASRLLRYSWLALVFWQLAWHAGLPTPGGSRNWTLAIIAVIPLLPFSRTVLKTSHRGMVMAMFMVMVYFMIGIMETWSNPPQRVAAAIQVILCCGYFAGLILFSRQARPAVQ